ncbi:anthranilate synthase component I [Perkinsela sp. CCAP 1560/4]|nr:anthranilate synthase component I [Perkinsela sp. CCAP 1560/4]|eukprot:KNH08298.1 anthranilate synthase component I [Perkinsela sp. CCAP 1560/4]
MIGDVDLATFYLQCYHEKAKVKETYQCDEHVLASYCYACNSEAHAKKAVNIILEELRAGYTPSIGALPAINAIALKAKEVVVPLNCIEMLCQSWDDRRKSAMYSCILILAKLGYQELETLLNDCIENKWLESIQSSSTMQLLIVWISKSLDPDKYMDQIEENMNGSSLLEFDDVTTSLMRIYLRKPGKKLLFLYKKARKVRPIKNTWLMILLKWADVAYYSLSEDEKCFIIREARARSFDSLVDRKAANLAMSILSSGIDSMDKSGYQRNMDGKWIYIQKHEFLRSFSAVFDNYTASGNGWDKQKLNSLSTSVELPTSIWASLNAAQNRNLSSFHGGTSRKIEAAHGKSLLRTALRRVQYLL